MKTTNLVAGIAVLLFASCDPAADTPRRVLGTTTSALQLDQVTVPAVQAKPVYTGQVLHYHEHLVVTAEGTVDLGAVGGAGVSPDGTGEICGADCVNPEGHRGALTAVIAESADETFACVFEVGAEYADRPRCQGRIFLVVNDDEYIDNAGAFIVRFDTAPLVRGSSCRKECHLLRAAETKACTDACTEPDPVDRNACVVDCAEPAVAAFDACIAERCAAEPPQPPDCSGRCSIARHPALRDCIAACPPPSTLAPCRHRLCAMTCQSEFLGNVATCLASDCGLQEGPNACMAACYGDYVGCVGDLATDENPCYGDGICSGEIAPCVNDCAARLVEELHDP
ncbi:MAG: hypothetical protein JXB32_13380 [Deltaproteobacteria bacterium]|nr:hypothetical protein [Deltaproteobacteria bacterium]